MTPGLGLDWPRPTPANRSDARAREWPQFASCDQQRYHRRIDHAGEITDVLPRNQQGVLQTELVLVRGDTPYHRFGYGMLGPFLYLFSC